VKTVTFDDLTWTDSSEPTQDAIQYIEEHYHFSPLDLEDCLSSRQISKIENYPDYRITCLSFPIYPCTIK
jgi:Mg2+ and Co2+ transporter CorA